MLDDNDAYQRKAWLENLDLINNNLSKFLEVMTELEKNMNTLGVRQDELNKKVDITNKLALEVQTEKESAKGKRKVEVNIPEFHPTWDTLDIDPPNIYTRKQKKKNRLSHLVDNPFFPSFFYTIVLNRCNKSLIKSENCLLLLSSIVLLVALVDS